ncbi:LysR family transcriptional regulator [Caproiciproducens faecalis]|uniref:LysR family transcriptional regulator n=1 Tax=Caproiciproducens faecalis TaxID=2820301 RepID=A0ABS7DRJ0_9FIRM|nr:LysR family transcriptional regulator [Caproiciproducens faecalis]
MNDRQLKYILTIAREGNLTSAAQKLYISQPSLSSMLAHVEEELDVKLFDRTVSPLKLTYAGEQYINAAEQILSIINDLNHNLERISNSLAGRLNIGCSSYFSSTLIPYIIPVFKNRYSDVQINLTEGERMDLEKKLMSGNLDLIFTTYGNSENKNIEYIPLYKEEFVLISPLSYVPDSYSESDQSTDSLVDLKTLENESFVLMKPEHQLRFTIDRIFQDSGFIPKVILETDSWKTCLSLAAEGMAFTILPNSEYGMPVDRLKFFRINQTYYRSMFLCNRKGAFRTKIMDEFINFTISLLKQRKKE